MAEFPSIPYAGPARSRWGSYRKRFMVVHCTANTAPPANECAYARTRTDGVGLHFASDPNTVLQALESWYATGHVGSRVGNEYGISWEFVGHLNSSPAYYRACVDRAAPAMRVVMAKWGIPHRWLTRAQMLDGTSKGLVTHKQCAEVFGGSDHVDPGPNFPTQYLIDALNGGTDMGAWDPATHGEYVMWRVEAIANARAAHIGGPEVGKPVPLGVALERIEAKLDVLLGKQALTAEDLARIEAAARAGAEDGAELTGAEVRAIVDEELDEQSRAGADTDS